MKINHLYGKIMNMKFEIENLNAINKASIVLDGLTVIVGENSSGKSTVARALFSTIKALNESEKGEVEDRISKIQKNINTLYKRINGVRDQIQNLDVEFPMPTNKFFNMFMRSENQKKFILEKWQFIEKQEITPRVKQLIKSDINKIAICLDEEADRKWLFAAEIQTLLETEFINNISQTDKDHTKVRFEMDEENVLEYTIHESQLDQFGFEGDSFIEDATYIESPLYLHILDSLLSSQTYKEIVAKPIFYKPMIPTHISDFVNKIDSIKYVNENLKEDKNEFKIDEITEGHFYFDKSSKKILFNYNGKNISLINVASGVKTFGTIQMLLDADYINENKMLLWDEPENHLHPAWQLEFANILVQLSKAGVPILVTTHSPYFLQAIRYYSALHDVEKYVNYYTSKRNKETKMSDFVRVNDSLNEVFTVLAEPLNSIMNVDEARKQ